MATGQIPRLPKGVKDDRANSLRQATDLALEERDLRVRWLRNQDAIATFQLQSLEHRTLLTKQRNYLLGDISADVFPSIPGAALQANLDSAFGQEESHPLETSAPASKKQKTEATGPKAETPSQEGAQSKGPSTKQRRNQKKRQKQKEKIAAAKKKPEKSEPASGSAPLLLEGPDHESSKEEAMDTEIQPYQAVTP